MVNKRVFSDFSRSFRGDRGRHNTRNFCEGFHELLRVMTYDGHVASDFSARRFAIARTITRDIATLSIPFIPWSMVDELKEKPPLTIFNEMKRRKEKRKYNFSYHEINRITDKNIVISELANEILTNETIKDLIKYDPLIESISDLKRGDLKGFLGLHSLGGISDISLKNEIKQSFETFLNLEENKIDFENKTLKFAVNTELDGSSFTSFLYVEFEEDSYGISDEGMFYYKKNNDNLWQMFSNRRGEDYYLYDDGDWRALMIQRTIKNDLMKECYTD